MVNDTTTGEGRGTLRARDHSPPCLCPREATANMKFAFMVPPLHSGRRSVSILHSRRNTKILRHVVLKFYERLQFVSDTLFGRGVEGGGVIQEPKHAKGSCLLRGAMRAGERFVQARKREAKRLFRISRLACKCNSTPHYTDPAPSHPTVRGRSTVPKLTKRKPSYLPPQTHSPRIFHCFGHPRCFDSAPNVSPLDAWTQNPIVPAVNPCCVLELSCFEAERRAGRRACISTILFVTLNGS